MLIHKFVADGGTLFLKAASPSCDGQRAWDLYRLMQLKADTSFYQRNPDLDVPRHLGAELSATDQGKQIADNLMNGPMGQLLVYTDSCVEMLAVRRLIWQEGGETQSQPLVDCIDFEDTVWLTTYPILGHVPRDPSKGRKGQVLVCTNGAAFVNESVFPAFPGYALRNAPLWQNLVSSVLKYRPDQCADRTAEPADRTAEPITGPRDRLPKSPTHPIPAGPPAPGALATLCTTQ